MKKLGFTLSELILALSIIGVVSAATVPMITGTMPDKNKVNVLKIYKLVNDININMITNSSLYINDGDCLGLECRNERPNDPRYNTPRYVGWQKYPRLLFAHLEAENDNIGNNVSTFNTVDGTEWTIRPGNDPETQLYTITVDFDREGNNCDFSRCDSPDRFVFNVGRRGYLTGNDPLTRAYLNNPHKLSDKKNDYAAAERLR